MEKLTARVLWFVDKFWARDQRSAAGVLKLKNVNFYDFHFRK